VHGTLTRTPVEFVALGVALRGRDEGWSIEAPSTDLRPWLAPRSIAIFVTLGLLAVVVHLGSRTTGVFVYDAFVFHAHFATTTVLVGSLVRLAVIRHRSDVQGWRIASGEDAAACSG